jgi:hypothetical protein
MNGSTTRGGRTLRRGLLIAAGVLALVAAAWRYDAPPDLGWDAVVLPLAALGIASLALAAANGTSWMGAAAYGGLYLFAQACGLQLVDTNRWVSYAHYSPWPDLGVRSLWLLPVAAQWIACLPALRASLSGLSDGVKVVLRSAPILVVIAFGAAVPAESPGRWAAETGLALFVTAGALLNLLAFARSSPAGALETVRQAVARRISLSPEADSPTRPWDRYVPWIAASVVFFAAAAFARVVLGGVPHIDDSVANLFQARTFAAGKLFVAAPPDSAAFQVNEVLIDGGRWFGYGFPGWPAVLSLGVRAGVPWLVNPVLAGLAVLLGHRLLLRYYGRPVANQATLLLATSPWLHYVSAEMMGHPLSLVLALAVLVLLERGRTGNRIGWTLAAGATLGALALTRPLDAGIIGLVAALWIVTGSTVDADVRLRASAAQRLQGLGALALGAVAVTSLLLAYNRALTGDATYTPQMMWTDRAWGPGSDRYGFGADVGIRAWPQIDPLPGHGPVDVALNLNKNLFAAGTDLYGWPGASLVLVLAGIFIPGRSKRARPALLLLVACVVAYSGYWFAGGPDIGPRYWYVGLPAFVVLSVLGANRIARMAGGARVGAAIALACLAALLTFVPWRAATRYYRFRDIGDEIRQLTRDHAWTHALVFVQGDREAYQTAFNFIDPELRDSRPIFAFDTGDAGSRAALAARFADRPVWFIGPGSERDRRLRVLAGPLPPGSADP